MTSIIDRRLNPRDKTIKNRQKFISRSKEAIRSKVREIIDTGSIKDIDATTKTKVKVKGINEPTFSIDRRSGDKKYVLPGNKQYAAGDKVPKEESPASGSGGKSAGKGKGEDDFEFILTEEEFADFLFDELELPHLIKKQLKNVKQVEYQKAGFKSFGTPNQMDITRTAKNAIARRIGLVRPKNEEIEELEQQLESETDQEKIEELTLKIQALKSKQIAVPWIDPFDVKYRNYVPVPKPISQAVMFCVMDVSASMQEKEKDIAKRFFMLLHMFLKRKYERLEVVFVSHHDEANEVDEDTFFHGRETGGTVVSTAIKLTNEIINERYNLNDWNVYVAQCSDGDNASYDDDNIIAEMRDLLPKTQYFAYVEVGNLHSVSMGIYSLLWQTYIHMMEDYPHFQMKMVFDNTGIWQVFTELFAKEQASG